MVAAASLGAPARSSAQTLPNVLPPPGVRVADLSGYALGSADAPLTMIEFADLQCPICRMFHMTVFDRLKREYIDTGKLRFVSRDAPIETAHPLAMRAAIAARCAGYQEKFWEMRHVILLNNPQLTPGVFDAFARNLKLDAPAFAACMANPSQAVAEIERDRRDVEAVHLYATPSFLIGRATASGLEAPLMSGAPTYQVLDAKLKALLAESPPPTR